MKRNATDNQYWNLHWRDEKHGESACFSCTYPGGCYKDAETVDFSLIPRDCPDPEYMNGLTQKIDPETRDKRQRKKKLIERGKKLKKIEKMLEENGPMPPIDIAKALKMSRHTLWDWRKKGLLERIRNPRKRKTILITRVNWDCDAQRIDD